MAASLSILWLGNLVGVVDEGFVAHCGAGGEGSAGQIYHSVSDFVVPENHEETSFLAPKGMLQGEMGVTTVALLCRGSYAVFLHPSSIVHLGNLVPREPSHLRWMGSLRAMRLPFFLCKLSDFFRRHRT